METTKGENKDEKHVDGAPGATTQGRNSNDDFNDDKVDDYGIDYSKPGAEQDLEDRITVKGGRGPKGGKRNANDNFEDEGDEADEYKA